MPDLTLNVNGARHTVWVDPHESLLDVLRERLGLAGTKRGCDQATCGACTVLLDRQPILSCITPALRCRNRDVRTIEGVALNGKLHPVQESLVESGGIQCGFCTPGMVMTILAFLSENPNPSAEQIRRALSGNLCRCTGYAKIVSAVQRAAEVLRS
ncbi:(2Fe-2S)-binding protein [candidate division KSB1 bacterium]|nr:(2Fe-2S)-binding protein [candidate division KSB1 bacterium]